MTSFKIIPTFTALLLLIASSCGNSRSGRGGYSGGSAVVEQSFIKSVSPLYGANYRQGEKVTISFTSPEDIVPDSAVLEIKGERIGNIDKQGHTLALPANHPVGRVPYRITVYKDGKSGSLGGEFTVFAAIAPRIYGHTVKKIYSHSTSAYTQGLLWNGIHLYESTGLEGESSLRKTELTGKVLRSVPLKEEYFGEGLAYHDGKLYQLTWQNNIALVYDMATFEQVARFGYNGEGWGLTSDGQYLYMSDGSEKIYVLDPRTFNRLRTIEVYTDAKKIEWINELEWIEGEIWANIYTTDIIIRIDPSTGAVTGIVDMAGLLNESDKGPKTDVLNGIAYDTGGKRIFVTGKKWPKLFEVEVFKKE